MKTHGIPGGSGLGLSISRELAILMGGTIEYSPRDDGKTGSIFTVTLVFDVPSEKEFRDSSDAHNASLLKGKEM